jgi:DNA-binding transcriptional regulator YdaS (Cro superfamily)
MTIKQYLRKYRLTRDEFATACGVGEKAVGHWVTGKRKPKPETVVTIERITGGKVTLADIYGHAG